MELGALVATFVTVLVVVLKKFNILKPEYEALLSAGLGLVAQIVLMLATNATNPTVVPTLTTVLNLLIGALSGIAGTQIGTTATQAKAAVQSLRK